MLIISIAIQKGGSGKTTTAINLAAALHNQGKKVLLVDADPQASLSISLGIREEPERNLYTEIIRDLSQENGELDKVIIETKSGLHLIPSSIELADADIKLVSEYRRESILDLMFEKMKSTYDYVFIDCPPTIGMLTVNALVASDYVLMPLQAEFLPLKGIRSFMHHFKDIKRMNKKLEILGFVLTRYDQRIIMNRQILSSIEEEFGEKVFHTHVRNNVQLAKAQEAGLDIFNFDPNSHGAQDYYALANEFIQKTEKSYANRPQ